MRPAAFLGALIGAILGALVWAGIATGTGLEIGWVAWGVGGLVGFGAALLGGKGATTGAVCAALALVAIFVGKWIAVDAVGEREVRNLATSLASMDVYEETRRDADDFQQLTSEVEYPEFMIVHGYTQAEYEDEVHELELMAFRQEAVPMLRTFHSMNLPYAQWKAHVGDEAVRMWNAEVSNTELVKDSLSFLDAIFALLGLVTAYQVGARGMGGAAIGAGDRVSGDRWRAPSMHGSRYGDTADGYAPHGQPASDAPILQDEPPNPYAHPGQSSQPAARPRAPAQPRTIGRLDQPPQPPVPQQQPEEAGTRNPYA